MAHPDDVAVDRFAEAMKAKLKAAREHKNRGGWQSCSDADLWDMLTGHIAKGDPVDIANFAAFLWNNQQAREERQRRLDDEIENFGGVVPERFSSYGNNPRY